MSTRGSPTLAELFPIRLEVITGGMHDGAAKGVSSAAAAALPEPNYRGFPWLLISGLPTSTSSVFISAAHFSDMHGYCKTCTPPCKERKSLSLVRHLILLLIIGEHDSSFSPFPKWATSSTVLLVITNLVGTCKE